MSGQAVLETQASPTQHTRLSVLMAYDGSQQAQAAVALVEQLFGAGGADSG